jgi:hypothetical protein
MTGQERSINPVSGFINETEMVSLNSLFRGVGWLFVTVLFSLTARTMMLSASKEAQSLGFQVCIAVLGGLGYASSVGAINHRTNRRTAKEFVRAEAEGKVAGAAAAVVIAEKAKDAQAARDTLEHPTIHAEKVEKVEVNNGTPDRVEEEHRWRDREPMQGLG